MDYTPSYFGFCTTCADRIKSFYGAEWSQKLKLMVIFRNPTDRVRSWFSHFQPAKDINPWVLQGFVEFGLYIPALAWPAWLMLGWLLASPINWFDKSVAPE